MRISSKTGLVLILFGLATLTGGAFAADMDEFKVKREEIFAFVKKPAIERNGDRVKIHFETQGFCDVTVAIENTEGVILRHLASGVLGKNAPSPFQKDSKKQTILWDGKDDQGRYIDSKDACRIRVSLGLKADFERSLFHEPRKRIGFMSPRLQAGPEGVYVFDGRDVDFLRLFDRDGKYVRTIYPFSAKCLSEVKGLRYRELPGYGRWPVKYGYNQTTLLSAGVPKDHRLAVAADPSSPAHSRNHHRGGGPAGELSAKTFSVRSGSIAVVGQYLNRLASDGTSGGLPILGAQTCLNMQDYTRAKLRYSYVPFSPTSSALSPDGTTVYLTGYLATSRMTPRINCVVHAVLKVPFKGEGKLEVFAGSLKMDDYGSDNAHFNTPTSVACDAEGRVYVSDHGNHRVQIFSAEGKWLKSINTPAPTKVMLHHKTGGIWICSFPTLGVPAAVLSKDKVLKDLSKHIAWSSGSFDVRLTRFGPYENPKKLSHSTLPKLIFSNARGRTQEQLFQLALDSWSEPPRLWIVNRMPAANKIDIITTGQKLHTLVQERWPNAGIRVLAEEGGTWTVRADFAKETLKTQKRVAPWDHGIQRIRVNPKNGHVYVLEQEGAAKSSGQLLEGDPVTGEMRKVPLPYRAEDFCFDHEGRVYLKTDREVVRYDAATWREVPWDYGEELKAGFDGPPKQTISALAIPAARPMWFHMGGMAVSLKGHLAVVCPNESKRFKQEDRNEKKWKGTVPDNPKHYTPQMYPGRFRYCEIHIWDQHGKLLYEDAIPGLGILDGISIDSDDNIYTMIQAVRMLDGKPYENGKTGTLMKLRPKHARLTSVLAGKQGFGGIPVPLPEAQRPKRPSELNRFWVDGAEWFYGGVGHCMRATGGCNCWHSRFTLDYFKRSFAPESERYSVAVLDTNGNLIMRIGQYGNVDDKGIGLIYPSYVATHSDRRIFVADQGNGRILSAKLGYHTEEKVTLNGVPDTASKK